MNKLEKFVSWLALIVSLTTIGLHIFKVLPFSVVDSNTFVSTIVAIIGILVTILVGYQIYEAVEINKKLQQIEEIKKQVQDMQLKLAEDEENTQLQFEKRRIEMEEQRCMILYEVHRASGNSLDSFLKLHEGLRFCLSTDSLKIGMTGYFASLKKAMLRLDNTFFEKHFGKKTSSAIADILPIIQNNDDAIRNHGNYYIVMDRYEGLMYKLYIRLDNIVKGKIVSPTEIDGVID